MNDSLVVPTDSLAVEVHTDARERLCGTLFAAPLAVRDAAGELAALLADDRRYLPLRILDDQGTARETLIGKAHMTYVRLLDAGDGGPADGPEGPRCHVFLADGESLAGTLDVPAPDARARLIDRLNRAGSFVPLITPTGPVFINRTMMVQVV